MSSEEHVRKQLGAYALGQLSPGEAAAVRAHLEGCSSCGSEAAEIERVAGLLPLADPDRLGSTPMPPEGLLDRVFDRIRDERMRSRRERRRKLATRAGLGLAAALIAVVVAIGPFRSSGEVVALAAPPGVTGEVTLHGRETSQYVELRTQGLPVGEMFAMWIRDGRTDEPVRCGTFRVTPGHIHIALYSSVPRDHATEVGVSTLEGTVVMKAQLPSTDG
jgi:anti-sigma factor RsiW